MRTMDDQATTSLPVEEDGEPLAGSVKRYERHLAVCTGGPPELWAARVEEMEGLFTALHAALRARRLHKQVKLTACDAPSTGWEGFDVFLLPDMLVLPALTVEKVGALADALQGGGDLPIVATPLPAGDHVFVCHHANRDLRCGTWGPRFYAALERELMEQRVPAHLHRSSHLGGHRFAAVSIIYPEGVWYGNLRPDDAPRLVSEHLVHRRLLPDKYRGRLGSSPCEQVAEAEAARVLARDYGDYTDLRVAVREHGQVARVLATASVPGPRGPVGVSAEFALFCPTVWWTPDEEPIFASDCESPS